VSGVASVVVWVVTAPQAAAEVTVVVIVGLCGLGGGVGCTSERCSGYASCVLCVRQEGGAGVGSIQKEVEAGINQC
jgi:hypothetical protein